MWDCLAWHMIYIMRETLRHTFLYTMISATKNFDDSVDCLLLAIGAN
jgi:hypothetical protein